MQKLLKAKYGSSEKPIRIGSLEIPCYVLEDGTRVLTQYGFYQAIGRSGKPAKGRGSSFEKMAPFLDLQNLTPYIHKELVDSTNPIKFTTEKGNPAWGYRAEILPKVCEVYLKARDDDKLLKSQEKFAVACDIVMRGLAHVGIIALVDEATGYQEIRDRVALQKILDQFITDEWAKWTKTFPDEFYKELFRLKNVAYPPDPKSKKKPSYVGHWTNDVIYSRLAPGVLDELKQKNPRQPSGTRRRKFHQYLTRDIGHPVLKELLSNVIFLMKGCTKWSDFSRKINRAKPKYGHTIEIPFDNDDK
ncbi:P63C domain-containing protein [Candidatus Latescibacterota bacterium]